MAYQYHDGKAVYRETERLMTRPDTPLPRHTRYPGMSKYRVLIAAAVIALEHVANGVM
jgi:hypothetical protein